jgi:hypothetical protein
MVAPVFSLGKVHEGVRGLQALAPSRAPRHKDDRIEELAMLIRAADDLLAQYPPETADEPLDVSVSRTLIQTVRRIAFGYMQEVNPDQAWFWTEQWQAGEREVDANIAAGRGTFYGDTDEFVAALDAARADLDRDADI